MFMFNLKINEIVTSSQLADSRINGVTIHLFQVMNPDEYTYSGVVKLEGDPYTETTPNGLVSVFPIQPNPIILTRVFKVAT